jgi:alcohol dehydrogenase class IV
VGFQFLTAPEIRFGAGEARKIPDVLARFGKRPFVVTGAKSIERLPVFEVVAPYRRWSVSGEPDVATVDEGARRCREAEADVVLGLGGGSVLDAAKAVAALATNGGSALEYLEQVGTGRTIERPPLPFVAVPTTAGSGSEATKNAVLRVPEAKVKRSLRHDLLLPRVAIVDPGLSAAAPRPVAASAGLDALTHLIEGFVSTGASPMTDALALPGIRLAARGLHGLADGRPEAESLALASLWGGIVLANAGLGAVHGLVAPLGGRCAIPHGIGCACLLVETMRANLAALRGRAPSGPALGRYEAAAAALGATTFDAALEELASLRRRLDVRPLSAYGVTEGDVTPIVQGSRGGSMKYNPVELSDAELEAIVRAAL